MTKILSVLCALAVFLSLAGCRQETVSQPTDPVRTFVAGYEAENTSGRILLNLMADGTAEYYAGTLENGVHTTQRYSCTYTLGENADFDETIRITGEHGTADGVIVDAMFDMALPGLDLGNLTFYETAPAAMDGDVYVGYLTKTSGMGPMAYAYALCLRDDATFHVSIMQMASVMHVWGATAGTWQADGQQITFTYDVRTDEGELVAADETALGSGFDGIFLEAAFHIQQNTMRASDARFIKVN